MKTTGLFKAGAGVPLLAAALVACGNDRASTFQSSRETAPHISQRFVGCIGPTAQPDTFVLSVAEARDFTRDEPPGTPIPQTSMLPEGAPPPVPPVTVTSGTPGGGPTPTTRIVTYALIGDGGAKLNELVGHTVEVLGSPRGEDERADSPGKTRDVLYVTSVNDIASSCK
jgi:hypothetical protein